MMSIYRQHFQSAFLDKVLQNLTNFLSNYVEICFMLSENLGEKCGRKMRSKNLQLLCHLMSNNVKKSCRKMLSMKSTAFSNNIFIPFSTSFDNPGARLFVKYQTKFLQKNVYRILQKNIKFCRNLYYFSEKNCGFVSIYSKKRWRFLLIKNFTIDIYQQ